LREGLIICFKVIKNSPKRKKTTKEGTKKRERVLKETTNQEKEEMKEAQRK